MGGSGKWVKSLIGLKKPDREDCKVRASHKSVVFGFSRFDFGSCPGGKIRVLFELARMCRNIRLCRLQRF
jgi:hypothetical protein